MLAGEKCALCTYVFKDAVKVYCKGCGYPRLSGAELLAQAKTVKTTTVLYAYYLPKPIDGSGPTVVGTTDQELIARLFALYMKHHDVSAPIHYSDGATIRIYYNKQLPVDDQFLLLHDGLTKCTTVILNKAIVVDESGPMPYSVSDPSPILDGWD
jgi:hypothetical protein